MEFSFGDIIDPWRVRNICAVIQITFNDNRGGDFDYRYRNFLERFIFRSSPAVYVSLRFLEQVRSVEIRRYTFLSVCSRTVHPEVFTPDPERVQAEQESGIQGFEQYQLSTINRKFHARKLEVFGEMSKVAREFLTFAQKFCFPYKFLTLNNFFDFAKEKKKDSRSILIQTW